MGNLADEIKDVHGLLAQSRNMPRSEAYVSLGELRSAQQVERPLAARPQSAVAKVAAKQAAAEAVANTISDLEHRLEQAKQECQAAQEAAVEAEAALRAV